MLRISEHHMAVFETLEMQKFQARLAAYLRKHYPQRMAALDTTGTTAFVAACMQRARHYGIETERDTALFAGLVARLGPRFDEQPQYAWVPALLGDTDTSSATVRLENVLTRIK